jgi:dTDP-4-dehydrorhamnose 3,5-epimerase-like enzyme
MMEKVFIEKLPYTKEKVGAKRWKEERGEFAQISYKEEIRHLALFEIRKGFSRGNHYHEVKEEIFYVASGKMRALFLDMDNLQREEVVLEMGDKIRIKPRCAHIFHGSEDTLVVEFSPQIFDPQDSYRVDLKVER